MQQHFAVTAQFGRSGTAPLPSRLRRSTFPKGEGFVTGRDILQILLITRNLKTGGIYPFMTDPQISVIMPVFNGEKQLPETLEALKAQTLADFEVLFVDDGSTDGTSAYLQTAAAQDPRIRLLQQPHRGAGAARNLALTAAKGVYVLFSDCDDLYQPEALEMLCAQAQEQQADVVVCNYAGIDARGSLHLQTGIQTGSLTPGCTCFRYADCPGEILRLAGTMVWNKLYRREFLTENNLRFDETFTCNDLAFSAVSMARAERITFRKEHLIHYRFPRLGAKKAVADAHTAVASALTQLQSLPHREQLQTAIVRFGIEHYIHSLKNYVTDFASSDAKQLYRSAYAFFHEQPCLDLDPLSLHNGNLYREFCTVQKHDYEAMVRLTSKKIIVSLTSYPKRIGTICQVLESILAQKKKADLVLLWLAQEQFPGKETDLPEALVRLAREGKVTIRWCDDLKPHKKYFYAFREYPDDLVITFDDDLLYTPNTISALYASYLLYPEAVSTVRAHLMVFDGQNQPVPYGRWIHETDICIHTPSMQLLATGGAGALYQPRLFRPEFLDEKTICDVCLHADDLWLKAMELLSDVPVVLARSFEQLHYLPDTQEDALFTINIRQGHNDVQLENILRWTDARFGAGTFLRKITGSEAFIDLVELSALAERERRVLRSHLVQTQNTLADTQTSLKQSQLDNKQLTKNLNVTQERLNYSQTTLANTQRWLDQNVTWLNQTRQKLRECEESKPINRQLKALGDGLSAQKAREGMSADLATKYLIYYLAWIPEKLLGGMMLLIQQGLKYTLKHFFGKFRRG